MITGIAASERVFQILSEQGITSLLDGAIYQEEPLSESLYQKRNISLFPLTTSNEDFLNSHVININIFCPDLATGQSDEVMMISIGEAVINALRAYRSPTDYFHPGSISSGIIKDENNRSYMNIRIEITTQ